MRRRTARPVPNPMDQIDPLGEWMVFHATVRYRRRFWAGHRIDIAPVAPVAANRFGKRSAPECRGAFCMPCSGTDTEHTGKAIRTDIRTRNKAKRKASQKRTHRKRSHTQPKANQKNKQSNNRQKTSIPTTKAENQKLYLPKRNHGRLAPCFAADAWELRYSAVLWVLLIRRRGFDPISAN